ncbi:HAMP domain-containing protein, partial [Nonomuraea angiospora]|uniref:HAMP domain-containing protein n=1 Tax=Nonomuraea angiospora TaxID=46172 RepID=UPI00331E3857
MTTRPGLGLQTRLLLAFALLCVVTAAAVAGGLYVQARNDILQRTQDATVQAMRSRLQALYPLRTPAPGPDELDDIATAVPDQNGVEFAVAVYREMYSPVAPPGRLRPGGRVLASELGVISPKLRQMVADGNIAWQRVVREGVPWLIIGTPLLIAEPDRTTRASGIEVYAARSLIAEQRSIDELAVRAWLIGVAALAFAVVLASLATRGVLRPVRELGRAARLLGQGELRTRITVHGSDELAEVAHTFNNTAAELERHVKQLREMEADARRFVA